MYRNIVWIVFLMCWKFCDGGLELSTRCTGESCQSAAAVPASNLVSKFEERLTRMNTHLSTGLLNYITNEITCPLRYPSTNLYNQTIASLTTMTSIQWGDMLKGDDVCSGQQYCSLCRSINSKQCHNQCTDAIQKCTARIQYELSNTWKMALGSVQTAVRLLLSADMTYGCTRKSNFTGESNAWREPFYMDENDKLICNQNISCGIGKSSTSTSEVKLQLEEVSKNLSRYWPRLDDPTTIQPTRRRSSEYIEGSGSGGSYYTSSGGILTDDEDLLNYDGSGDSEEFGSGNGQDLDDLLDKIENTTSATEASGSTTHLISGWTAISVAGILILINS